MRPGRREVEEARYSERRQERRKMDDRNEMDVMVTKVKFDMTVMRCGQKCII
jgi:hypothetical protein